MIPKDCQRLAEVDFPIAEVSRHAAREKSIRHGHPSTLHLWWARRHAVPSRPAQPAVPPGTTGLGDRAWRMERDGRGWIMNLKGLSWEEPQGLCLKDSEDAYLQAERQRLIYVAATRARDLLVVPKAGSIAPVKYVCGDLLAEPKPALIHEMEMYRYGRGATWAQEVGEPIRPSREDSTNIDQQVTSQWASASAEAGRPRYRPVSVTGEARAVARDEAGEQLEPFAHKPRQGRFGSLFGGTVHYAVEHLLRDPTLSVEEAVRRAAKRIGLTDHLDEAMGDVSRALNALRSEGLLRPMGPTLEIEYPVAGVWGDGQLLSGYIDLVGAGADRLDVIDLKTDPPPQDSVELAYPEYISQVRMYGRLLESTGLVAGRRLRSGLLFSADGVIRWFDLFRREDQNPSVEG